MSIVLDPQKSLISIVSFYIEEKKEHGNTYYHFIDSKEELDEWKENGYKTREEILDEIKQSNVVEEYRASSPSLFGKNLDPEKLIELGDYKIIHKLTTHWKQPTWKDTNSILSKAMKEVKTREGYSAEVDPLLYRELKLKTGLKGWDAKDDKGYDIPLTEQAIDNLVNEVANALLKAFERVCERPTNLKKPDKNKEENEDDDE